MSSARVFGADLETGRLLWQAELVNYRNNNVTDPIFHDGHVFASSGYGAGSIMVRLEKSANGVDAKPIWKSKVLDNHHGGVVLIDGHLYGSGHQSKGWHCLDFRTGKSKHRGDGKGSLTYAEGMLYCLDETGTMSLVRAEPGQHAVVSSFAPPKGGKGLWWAHPVVCNGRLYLRHDDRLFAYDIKAR
jgi:outer membrane protein assembly factor BamB